MVVCVTAPASAATSPRLSSSSMQWKIEATLVVFLGTMACMEVVLVHALISDALTAGNAALDVLNAMARTSA